MKGTSMFRINATRTSAVPPAPVPRRSTGRARLRRLSVTLIVGALVPVLTATACTSGGSAQPSAGQSKTLTLAAPLAPASFAPAGLDVGGPLAQMWKPVFDTLLREEQDGTLSGSA